MNQEELRQAAFQAESEAPQTFVALERIQADALAKIADSPFAAHELREQMYHLVQACKALRLKLLGLSGHAEMIRKQEAED